MPKAKRLAHMLYWVIKRSWNEIMIPVKAHRNTKGFYVVVGISGLNASIGQIRLANCGLQYISIVHISQKDNALSTQALSQIKKTSPRDIIFKTYMMISLTSTRLWTHPMAKRVHSIRLKIKKSLGQVSTVKTRNKNKTKNNNLI